MSLPAITGLGLHGAAGSLAEAWGLLQRGDGCVRACAMPSADEAPATPGCPAAPFDLSDLLPDRKLRKYMNDATQLAVLAAGRALADGGLLGDAASCSSTALYFTTGVVPFELAEALPALLEELEGARDAGRAGAFSPSAEAFRRCNPLLPFKLLLNVPLGLVSIVFGLGGENGASYPGAQQAAVGLEIARRGVVHGRFPRALVGGSARQLTLAPLLASLSTGRVAATAAQADPAQPCHAGVALADAAACLVIEDAAEAARRGARVRAVLESVASVPPDGSRFEERAGELLGGVEGAPPDAIVETGLRGADEVDALLALARERWPSSPAPALVSFDGRLGFAGAAAMTSTLALASHLFDPAGPPPSTLVRAPRAPRAPRATGALRRLLVLSHDLDGALAAAVLLAPGEASA